jgi:hypothetical protein
MYWRLRALRKMATKDLLRESRWVRR